MCESMCVYVYVGGGRSLLVLSLSMWPTSPRPTPSQTPPLPPHKSLRQGVTKLAKLTRIKLTFHPQPQPPKQRGRRGAEAGGAAGVGHVRGGVRHHRQVLPRHVQGACGILWVLGLVERWMDGRMDDSDGWRRTDDSAVHPSPL